MSILQKGKNAKVSKVRQEQLKKSCESWQRLCLEIGKLTIQELDKALYLEFKGAKRPHILDRLIGRRNKLQNAAYRAELGIVRKAA